jgi:hypothetical protein
VVVVVCGVAAVGALVTLLLNRRTWKSYDESHLVLDSEAPRRARAGGGAAAVADAERDEEIRQMIEARNARRRRRGEPELDAAAEVARLSAPAIDDELAAEIRDMVVARNHRRARRGEPPLDVEAEIARQIAELQGP